MKKKLVPILVISSLFALSSLTGCSKEEIAGVKSNLQEQIDEIKTQIEELQAQIATLRSEMNTSIAGVEEEFTQKINALNTEISELENELNALKTKHDQDKAALQSEYQTKVNELTDTLNSNVASLQDQVNSGKAALEALTAKHNEDVAALQADYNQKINALSESELEARNALKTELESSISEVDSKYEAQVALLNEAIASNTNAITLLTTKHNEDKAAIEADYNQKLNALAEQDAAARAALKAELEESISQLDSDFDAQIATLQGSINDNASSITSLTNKHDQDKAALEADYNQKISDLEEEDAAARQELEEELTKAIDDLNEEYQKAVEDLQSSIDANKEAIVILTNKLTKDIAAVTADYNAQIKNLAESEQEARAKLQEEFQKAIEDLNGEFSTAILALQDAINANTNAITALVNKHNEDKAALEEDYNSKIAAQEETDLAARNALKSELETQINNLDEEFQNKVLELQTGISDNLAAIATLTETHNNDILNLVNDYNKQISDLADSEQAAREKLAQDFENDLGNLAVYFEATAQNLESSIAANTQAINDLVEQFATDKAALEADYNEKISDLDTKYTQEVASINNQISALQTSVTNLTSEMNQQISNIQADYNEKINALTGRVTDLEQVEYHTVTFDVEGYSVPSQVVKHGEKATRPIVPDAPGYYYEDDWYIYNEDESLREPWYFYSATVTEDITLHLLRFPYSYEIRLNENYPGGTLYTKDGLVYSGEDFTCPVPYYDAQHVFEGWYYGDRQVTDASGNSVIKYDFAGDVILMAKWGSGHDGLTAETAFTVDEALAFMSSYSVGDWSDQEYYVTGTFATGTTYNPTHQCFTGYTVDHMSANTDPFKVYNAALDSSIENKYGADGCLDGATFIVHGYLTLYADATTTAYEVAYDKDKSTPVIVYLDGATEKEEDTPPAGYTYATLSPGENSYYDNYVNGTQAVKCGTSSKAGSVSFTVKEGATELVFYAGAWKGTSGTDLDLSILKGETLFNTVSLQAVEQFSGSSKSFTLDDVEIYKFTVDLGDIDEDTTITLTMGKRFIVWNVMYK